MPWGLRDHYAFTFGKSTFCYAVENAQWGVMVEELGLVLDNVGARVALADGATVDIAGLTPADTTRETFESGLGQGSDYGVVFSPKDGLAVRHTVSVYKTRPFVLIRVTVTNVGETPLEIAGISPVVVGPHSMANLSAETRFRRCWITMRGTCRVFDKSAPPLMALLNDSDHDVTLVFGVLPGGVAASGVRFQAHGGAWQGEVACVFDPPLALHPGESLEADRVLFSWAISQPSRADLYYAWAQSTLSRLNNGATSPECWVTVEDGGSADALYAASRTWSGIGTGHVLVPGTWERRPGSFEGAPPLYPTDMRKVAHEIQLLNMKPGLTVDPLAVQDGSTHWTALSADGQRWLNARDPEAREFGAKELRKAVEWGFQFFVVRPSLIPDEVLKQFNMTRTQADMLAFEIVAATAHGLPVLPSAAASLRGDLDAWLEAASCSSRAKEYGVGVGPVRCAATNLTSIDESLATAMTFYGGPIEFVGSPNSSTRKALARLFPRPGFVAYPLDSAKSAPRLWQIRPNGSDDNSACAVVMFAGASSWDASDLGRDALAPVRIWRAEKGQYVDLGPGPVPTSDKLAVYGAAPVLPHPVLLGASLGLDLLLSDVTTVWDDNECILSGAFRGRHQGHAAAFVSVPKPWVLRQGKAGDERIGRDPLRGMVTFDVPPGMSTNFDLRFKRE